MVRPSWSAEYKFAARDVRADGELPSVTSPLLKLN
jgi:hypothetical protein